MVNTAVTIATNLRKRGRPRYEKLHVLSRPYLAMGQGGQLPPQINWLQSIIK